MRSPLDVVKAFVEPPRGAAILDVGCGAGALVRALDGLGARACGIDPSAEAIRAAALAAPGLDVRAGRAEELPYAAASFRAVTIVNALHHVPVADQRRALEEARRVLRPEGLLLVFEPLAAGSFFAALRPVEDETAVRAAAQEALAWSKASGLFGSVAEEIYVRREEFADSAAFVARVVAVDPSRAAAVARDPAGVAEAVLRAAGRSPRGRLVLEQPIKVDVLRAP